MPTGARGPACLYLGTQSHWLRALLGEHKFLGTSRAPYVEAKQALGKPTDEETQVLALLSEPQWETTYMKKAGN